MSLIDTARACVTACGLDEATMRVDGVDLDDDVASIEVAAKAPVAAREVVIELARSPAT